MHGKGTMRASADIHIGQLALARGLVSLSELLRCAQREALPLDEALREAGHLSEAQLEALRREVQGAGELELARVMEQGHTAILTMLHHTPSTRDTLAIVPAQAPPQTPVPSELEGLPEPLMPAPERPRYELLQKLGQGGMGQVWLAHDQLMQREVALKSLAPALLGDQDSARRLVMEAKVTGALEHPSIIPIYDLGQREPEGHYYTMRIARERSLEDILSECKAARGESEYSQGRLVAILRMALMALQYAHDQGVIHRDLKPENLLIGSYGEVFVIDWGVAKILPGYSLSALNTQPTGRGSNTLVGTPHYMAPEQALGEQDEVGPTTDIYAMGAILYEVLTLERVFHADHVLSLLFKVTQEVPVPPSQRAPHRMIPAALEEICLRALAKDPAQRYESAQAMVHELDLYLEGIKERERREALALSCVSQGDEAARRYEALLQQQVEQLAQLDALKEMTPSWAPLSQKAPLWEREQGIDGLRMGAERSFGEAIRAYGQALDHQPDLSDARQALAALYWRRFELAERAGDEISAAYFEGLVRQHDEGEYAQQLQGLASLTLEVISGEASVSVYRYERQLLRLQPVLQQVRRAPLRELSLPHGSYLLVIEARDRMTLRIPVLLGRLEAKVMSVALLPAGALPAELVVIPAGEFLSGRIQPLSLQQHRMTLPEYAIMRHPVTCAQYLDFLNDLATRDMARAMTHAPRVGEGAPYFEVRQGRFWLPEEDAEGDRWELDWPIFMINAQDAEAYARWRSKRDGLRYRLPTAQEWEKAARGVDGRIYPWGDRFDAAFCNVRDSQRQRPMIAPVGSSPFDCSPYGLTDLAGNVLQWTSSWISREQDARVLQGNSFNSTSLLSRLDWSISAPPHYRFVSYGFRLVAELPETLTARGAQ